jgi:hypothetical protein
MGWVDIVLNASDGSAVGVSLTAQQASDTRITVEHLVFSQRLSDFGFGTYGDQGTCAPPTSYHTDKGLARVKEATRTPQKLTSRK